MDKSEKYLRYDELFRRSIVASADDRLYKLICEEFTFNDREGTKSQFTKKQKDTIKREYDIPISTKIAYPIVEQLTAMLTASAPYPRLIAAVAELKEVVAAYEGAYQSTWYECKGNNELKLAVRDALTVGSGFLHVRKASLLTETTFGVVVEHVSWKNVYIDPDSKKSDFSDARYHIIAQLLTVERAEEDYDIKLTDDDLYSQNDYYDSLGEDYVGLHPNTHTKEKDYVWLRRIYEREIVSIYVSPDNQTSLKKPKPIDIPNPEKESLREQIQGQIEGVEQTSTALANVENQTQTKPDAPVSMLDAMGQGKEAIQETNAELGEDLASIEELTAQFEALPDTIEVFEFVLETGETIQVQDFERMKAVRIRETELVGRRVVSSSILPIDLFPLVHFCNSHNRNPNQTYGVVHYIMDMIKALNKVFAMAIKEMQTSGNRKVFVAEGSVTSLTDFESKYSQPHAVNTYIPNPQMPDGGMPKVIEPAPINSTYTYLIDKFQSLVEYTTGVNAMIAGNPQENNPTTYGVAQQMASFGTQRIKLYARNLEGPLEDLAEVVIGYLSAYGNRDKVAQYFDSNGELKSAQIFDDGLIDLQFKVRVDVGSNLPTTRQMFAQMLALLSSQTKNPQVADQLTKVLLGNLDMPAADKLAEEIDQITKLSQEIEAAKEENKKLQGENDSLKFNLEQTQISAKVKEEALKIIQELRMNPEKAQAVADMTVKTNGEGGNPLTNYMEENKALEQAPESNGGMPTQQSAATQPAEQMQPQTQEEDLF